ncbi:hypothetical protein [Pseudomonas sp. W4I3]|uniref:hypothetical protein n=1 Tax=Pseudomonas sp. W4I3 TaxID=3042294 RepID=UPI00278859A0|nr:hypothetical protein [Pseudomonas sp. W4I3]MDQ0739226.1 hypothetical protein [Pseudomonas sp. W4I3]
MRSNQNSSDTRTFNSFEPVTPVSAPLELTADLRYILGIPHTKLANTAQLLRQKGHCIAERSEDEQAAVIHWMLGHYLRRGIHWRVFAYAELDTNDDFPGFPGDEALSEDATEQECPTCSDWPVGFCDGCIAAGRVW